MTHLHCTSHSHLHTSVCSVHNVQSIYDSHAGQHEEKQNREKQKISLVLRCTNISRTWSRCYIFKMNAYMIINACIGRLQVCVSASRGCAEPGFPPGIWNMLFQALSPRKWAVGMATEGRWVCVCVCVWGMEGSKQETIVHKQQTRRRIYDRYRWVPRWHTHTHSETGWRQAALGFTVTCYTILRLPAPGSNARTSRRPGWRESGLPSIQIPIRNTQHTITPITHPHSILEMIT